MAKPRYMQRPPKGPKSPKPTKRDAARALRQQAEDLLDRARLDAERRDWHRFLVWCLLCALAFALGAWLF